MGDNLEKSRFYLALFTLPFGTNYYASIVNKTLPASPVLASCKA